MRATDKQIIYLRTLLKEAFSALYSLGIVLPHNQLHRCSREEASAYIAHLLKAKAAGWIYPEFDVYTLRPGVCRFCGNGQGTHTLSCAAKNS